MPIAPRHRELCQKAQDGDSEAAFLLGMRCFSEGDNRRAAHYVKDAAVEGHAEAQFQYGLWYYNGLILKNDFKEAAIWFNLAAEQNHSMACYYLAEMQQTNKGGVGWDDIKAMEWCARARPYNPSVCATLGVQL